MQLTRVFQVQQTTMDSFCVCVCVASEREMQKALGFLCNLFKINYFILHHAHR